MVRKIVLAIVVGIVVTILCTVLGGVLGSVEVAWAATLGKALQTYAGLLGLLAALWQYFAGSDFFAR